jgi:hypothetical protein
MFLFVTELAIATGRFLIGDVVRGEERRVLN